MEFVNEEPSHGATVENREDKLAQENEAMK